ncbi:MAG: hypothetical protein N2112_15765 [Gemmataceae bacterium]|nr:hypothetical protein [Gemmataceae bacterium]
MRNFFGVLLVLSTPYYLWAGQFDYYTAPILAKAVADNTLKELKEIDSEAIADAAGVLNDSQGTFLVVYTNDARYCKLLVQSARHKIDKETTVPMLLIDQYVTFKEGTETTRRAEGKNVFLFPSVRLQLDIGQIVPEKLGGDITIEQTTEGFVLKPLGKAKLYLLTKPIAGVVPKKAPKLVVGESFEPRYFIGTYKLHDDGRRSGIIKLQVNESGEISGTFTSDKDGAAYDIKGKVGNPKHSFSFVIKFPATEQLFTGYLFTGNAKAMAGTSKLAEREAAFYAERLDEE